jgi:hypothetical protein
MTTMLPDDTESLQRYLPGGRFDYHDISGDRARQRALRRWPLLAEVAQVSAQQTIDNGQRQQPQLPGSL